MNKNYKHILVPLDGSDLAEAALDDALCLAESTGAQLTLLQVIQPAETVIGAEVMYPIYLDQQWENQKLLALNYLNNLRQRHARHPLTINLVVELGAAGETIIDYAHQHPVDLIVMATHGRSGLSRWVYGSVADKVLRGAGVPVLLVRVREKQLAA